MASPHVPINFRLMCPLTTYQDSYHRSKQEEDIVLPPVKEPPVCRGPVILGKGKKRFPSHTQTQPKNTANMMEYKKYVKFDMFLKPKDIIGTSPNDVQKAYTKDVNPQTESVRLSRPKLVMPPAVSLDEIQDKNMRDIIVKETYDTSNLRAAREVPANVVVVKAPLPEIPAPSFPIFRSKLKPRPVDAEWRWDSVYWDKRQLRGHCEVTKEAWTRWKKPVPN